MGIELHPVEALFRTVPAPRPVVADLVYFEPRGETPEYWTVRLYRDDFEFEPTPNGDVRPRSAEDKVALYNWVSDLIRTLRLIEPHCYVEVYEVAPR